MSTKDIGPVDVGQEYGTWVSNTANASSASLSSAQRSKVTKAEEMRYSADLAPTVRDVGHAMTTLHDTMRWLSDHINDSRKFQDSDTRPDPPYVVRWRKVFAALAPIHDALIEADREIAAIAVEAARDEQTVTDTEHSAFMHNLDHDVNS